MWESQAALGADFCKRLREAALLVAFRRRGIATAGAGAVSLLGFQLHTWLKEVGVELQRFVQSGQQTQLLVGVAALIADRAPHHRVVLLLDKATVVLAIWPRAGEGNSLVLAI